MTVCEILEKMRYRYASAPSHVPATFDPPPGKYCMVTAYDFAVHSGSLDYLLGGKAFTALRAATGNINVSLVDYNAEHSTEEVLAVFDKAIASVS